MSDIAIYRWIRMAKTYNRYMGIALDHVAFRTMYQALGPIERAQLFELIAHDADWGNIG